MKSDTDMLTPGKGYVVDSNGKTEATTIRDFRPKRNYEGKWFSIHNNHDNLRLSMKQQAISRALNWTEYRIRDYLLEDIGCTNNFETINQSRMGKDLNIKPSNVSKSLKRLVDLDILQKDLVLNKYRFNPAFAFAGSLDEGMKAKRRYKAQNYKPESVPWLN